MHILGLIAENYKRLRVVQITPKGRVIQVTGKNGQGKTSVLDAIWAALIGAKAIPEKPVRKGAEKARIKLNLGEFIVTRTINTNGTHSLTVENAKGVKITSPQAVLDELLGALTFDPLAFVAMKPKEQVETLRQVAKIDLDVDALNSANATDYDQRTIVNREVKRLEGEIALITVQAGLPKDKVDEQPIVEQLNEASQQSKLAAQLNLDKQELGARASGLGVQKVAAQSRIDALGLQIKALEKQLKDENKKFVQIDQDHLAAEKAFQDAPTGEAPDVGELTRQLQAAQLTNREIDKRERRARLEQQLRTESGKAEEFTRAIERREEEKKAAIQNAQMPVPGLSFDEKTVHFNGIPLEQLGEAEQIRISTSIAMAANPKLRVLRIMHGEALDDDSMKVLADMAEANDFQIWMAKVDSSGKVGVVLEDGMVKSEEE